MLVVGENSDNEYYWNNNLLKIVDNSGMKFSIATGENWKTFFKKLEILFYALPVKQISRKR